MAARADLGYRLLLAFHLVMVAAIAVPTASSLTGWQVIGRPETTLAETAAAPAAQLRFVRSSTDAVDLTVDTGGNVLTSVDLTVSYPSDRLRVTGIVTDGSPCSDIVTRDLSVPGRFRFACTMPIGSTKQQIVALARLQLVPLQTGRASFAYLRDVSNLTSANAANPQTAYRTTNATFAFSAASPTSPLAQLPVISTTHPRDLSCSKEPQARVQWIKQGGVTDFQYELNDSPTEVKNLEVTEETALSLPVAAGSTHYLHVRARAGSQLSQFTVVPLTTCPSS